MNIPPLISRTPPPLPDDDVDDDDDDEFGHYVIGEVIENGVTNVYDDFIEDATSSGVLNNHLLGSKSTDDHEISTIGLDFQLHPEETELQQPSLFTKDEHSPNYPEIDEDISCTVSNCDSSEPEIIRTASDRECLQPNGLVDNEYHEDCTAPSETFSEATATGDNLRDDSNQSDEFSTYERPVTISDGEFTFVASDLVTNGKTSLDDVSNSDEVASTIPTDIVRPDLKDFPIKTETAGGTTLNSSTSFHDFDNGADGDAVEPFNNEDVDDDFDDFADFQTSAPDAWKNEESKTKPDNFEGFTGFIHEKMDDTGPSDTGADLTIGADFKSCLLDEINTNAVWGCLQCLDDTPALKYQWLSSSSNHRLLSALKIDSRNIFCGPWTRSSKSLRLEVCQSPKAISSIDHPSSSHHSSSNLPVSRGSSPNLSFTPDSHDKSSVPDPLFDWEGSGLVNPLFYSAKEDRSFDCDTRRGVVENLISVEVQEVLKSLPDLSFMTKTYITFKSIPVAK